MSIDDQARYINSMKRTVATAARLGLPECRANYWDDFLVRGVAIVDSSPNSKLTAHTPKELSLVGDGVNESERDPFIFNPFAKSKAENTNPVVVAGELVTFSVALQNTLEVEIDIDNISLLAEGCDFVPSYHGVILGPFCTEVFTLTGTPRQSGSLSILGCVATIRDCHRRTFQIFRDHWEPPKPSKQPFAPTQDFTLGPQTSKNTNDSIALQLGPPVETLRLKVIPAQPRLIYGLSSLVEPSLMLLEGQSTTVSIEMVNQSREMMADFVLFTFQDNVTNSLQETLTSRGLGPVEVYEIQRQLTSRPAVKLQREQDHNTLDQIAPQEKCSYVFEVYGKPGLTQAAIQTDLLSWALQDPTSRKRFTLVRSGFLSALL